MTDLETWLKQATRHLSKDSVARVRTEIQEHYESAREAALSNGATTDEAERLAVTALGDAKSANCQYRDVLLTSAEARILREGEWERRAFCSWRKWLLPAIPGTALLAASACFFAGAFGPARTLLVGGIGMGLCFGVHFLPVYTPSRARVFRPVKWILLAGTLLLAFGPDAVKWSWLLTSCLWPLAWIEWTRISIRRKLPVAQWPKQLYL
jgi:hypothetical protein